MLPKAGSVPGGPVKDPWLVIPSLLVKSRALTTPPLTKQHSLYSTCDGGPFWSANTP